MKEICCSFPASIISNLPVAPEALNVIDFSKSNNCNIHAIEIINKSKIKIKTYEHGVGVTTSCGSGSICAFFVCNMLGKVGNSAEILTDGGSLFVEMSNNKYILKGVSNLIFKGEYYGI